MARISAQAEFSARVALVVAWQEINSCNVIARGDFIGIIVN